MSLVQHIEHYLQTQGLSFKHVTIDGVIIPQLMESELYQFMNGTLSIDTTEAYALIRDAIALQCADYICSTYHLYDTLGRIFKKAFPETDECSTVIIPLPQSGSKLNIDLSVITYDSDINYNRSIEFFRKGKNNSVIYEYTEYVSIEFESWTSLLREVFH